MNNYKELKVEEVYKKQNSFNEISLIEELLFWKESLNINGSKNNAIFARPTKHTNLRPQQLTSNCFCIKSSFHGYGGRSYQCFKTKSQIYIVWIDQLTGSLWAQKFQLNKSLDNIIQFPYLIAKEEPRQISKASNGNFDASFALFNDRLLFGILEINNRDYLFSIFLDKKNQDLKIIKKFDNFAGSLSSNLGGRILSWIEWGSEFMPWENNNLFFAEINSRGEIKKIKSFNKLLISDSTIISFFQPYWLSQSVLVCSEDSSGWWNLIFFEVKNLENIIIKNKIRKKYFDYGLPQWVSGISLFSGSKERFFCLARNKDSWILEYYRNLVFVKQIKLPFTIFSDLYADSNNLILKAASNLDEEQLVELDVGNLYEISIQTSLMKRSDSYSKSETIWFEGFDKRPTHAWIYKCKLCNSEKPPLIVKAHSGPTSYFNGGLNSEVEFWTSRGWIVAEVNYGGSSCFGKDYRNRLNGNWGVVDSEDCKALVRFLIKEELVDESRIVIFGNSAGGFTALNSLCNESLFKAAICKYPVLDLNEMHLNTHRFEKNYLNSLIGNFDINKDKYFERSPINKIDQISHPVLIFHGKKDLVIDYKISLKFNKKLLKNNIYSEIHLYKDEGHGIKDIKNKLDYLLVTELFLKKIFIKS